MRLWSAGRLRRATAAISLLSVMSMLALAGGGPAAHGAAQDASHMRVASASDSARGKINPQLLQTMAQAPQSAVKVHAYARAGADLTAYMPDALSRTFVDTAGNTFVTGTVKASNLLKLAGIPDVVAILPMTGAYAPAIDPADGGAASWAPSAELQARMSAHVQSGVKSTTAGGGSAVAPDDWYDVLNDQDSQLAWDKGYTGAGVKVMVNDSGIDFANPDLMGTQARVTDPSSPYYGWPEQFDQLSMYLWANDVANGTNAIASGAGQYADTSTVITAANPTFQSLDATEAATYVLPGTSQSGNYHIGTHPDNTLRSWYRIINGLDLSDPDVHDERPAVLVVDEGAAGVYDTVYVDLDFDHDFTDDKPLRKGDEIAGVDWWGAYDPAINDFSPQPDGFYDESGGMIYWISDGVNPIPASDWYWGLGVAGNGAQDPGEPGAGNLVAFSIIDFSTSPAGDHGTLTASNVAAQGVTDDDPYGWVLNGDATAGRRPSYKPEGALGMVVGAGKDVGLVSAGDFYSYGGLDAFIFAALGYDGVAGTDDDIQIISNSWGSVQTYNDGWDLESRIIDYYHLAFNQDMTIVFSAGNDGPGFGSVSGPEPSTAITVAASTQYGSTGWDSLSSADQMLYGDIAAFSSRGPGATGTQAVDIAADGARASGSVPLNEALNGAHAWETWGGTSRSGPVVAGNTALMYQAYKEAHGTWPDFETARAIMMSGAQDLHYDPLLQGAGLVNGNRAVDLASGTAGSWVSPSSWQAGDYQGANYPGFANIMTPGQSSTGAFEINNPSDQTLNLTVGDRWMQKSGTWEMQFTSAPVDQEPLELADTPFDTGFDWNTPMYVWNVTDQIPADTDLMVFRQDVPYDQVDPTGTYDWQQVNDWYLMAFDWTDVNGDGNLWSDDNGNGVVDPGEMDAGEYNRYGYSNQRGTASEITIQRPQDRHHDGIFIGLMHNQARADIPQTTMTLGLDFYTNVDFPWMSESIDTISIAPGDSLRVNATVDVPGDAPAGVYEAAMTVSDGYWTSIVPVTVNVAARDYNMTAGGSTDGASFYDNGSIAGMQSWNGNAVSGDYRQYFVDLHDNPAGLNDRLASGTTYFLADVSWQNLPTDVNIQMLGPTMDELSDLAPEYFGPYTLGPLASSNEGLISGGTFLTQTTSGTSREVIAGPYTPGLNELVLHNVNYAGLSPSEQIAVRAGALAVSQSPIDVSRSTGDPTFHAEETVISTLALSGLQVEGFGLSKLATETGLPIHQDDPNDPTTASFTREIHLDHAGLLAVAIAGQETDDLDLYLLYDANGDGEFTPDESIASSTTPTANELVAVTLPADGDYLVLVHGWSVPEGDSTFDMTVIDPQGYDISASGLPNGEVLAGQPYTFTVDIDGAGYEPGVYIGLVALGPPEGPAAVQIPVTFEIRGQ